MRLFVLIFLLSALKANALDISVKISDDRDSLVISSDHPYALLRKEAKLYAFAAGSETLVQRAPASENDIVLSNSGKLYPVSGTLYFAHLDTELKPDRDSKNIFQIKNRSSYACQQLALKSCGPVKRYRGTLAVDISPLTAHLRLVNKLDVDDYIRGVVNSEMPRSWPLEAMKAQAVAARTYAAKRSHRLMQPDVADQMYLGYNSESSRGNQAVEDTSNQILKGSSAEIVDAYYSSSGGRYTAAVDQIWYLSPRPYLLPQLDDASGSSYKNWKRDYSFDDFQKAFADLDIGEIESIYIFGRTMEGRINKVLLSSWDRTQFLTGEEFRHKLKLPSTFAKILNSKQDKYDLDPSKKIYFVGQGFGHGIGMSQYGAKNMANDGKSYEEILLHYYQGAVLEKLED